MRGGDRTSYHDAGKRKRKSDFVTSSEAKEVAFEMKAKAQIVSHREGGGQSANGLYPVCAHTNYSIMTTK